MKYYNHAGEEITKEKYDYLVEMDLTITGNCFEENLKDSKKLLNVDKVVFDEDGNIESWEFVK